VVVAGLLPAISLSQKAIQLFHFKVVGALVNRAAKTL